VAGEKKQILRELRSHQDDSGVTDRADQKSGADDLSVDNFALAKVLCANDFVV